MSQPRLQAVVHHLRGLLAAEERVADAELLARFADRRDEAAFTMLVQRQGPMVLGICRRMLRLPADADDAWQATFLVLARKASSIRRQASIAAWLHGVALRVCQRSREKTQRHKHRQLPADLLQPENDDLSWREVRRILDEEIERLPDRLRQPIVLCYLEGKTRDEAAEELGWTMTTFRGRLDTARERLRKRLVQRGLTLPSALLATLLSQAGEVVAIPQPLLEALLPAAVSGSASASLTPLIEGGIKAMSATKMPAIVSVVLAAGLMIGGGAHFGQKSSGPGMPAALAAAENTTAKPPEEEPAKEAAKKPDATADILKDVEANTDRLQVTFELLPADPKGGATPPFPLRYVMLNVLPIPIEPHGKWPNGAPIGADARITKEQANKIVAALNKLEFFQRAASDRPAIETMGAQAKLHIRYRPDGATETRHYWRPLGWDLKMLRHLQTLRACVDGDAAKHLDAMLESLAPERKKWETDVDWGAAIEGLQLRARCTQPRLNAGEQPAFEIDLRNQGKKNWTVAAVPPLVEVEVDGKWHAFSGDLDYKATIRALKPGEQLDKWMTVVPDKTWGHPGDTGEARKALEWKPGKHKVRLAYSIQGKVHLHSQEFEIEIVDPKEVGWGEPVEGLQLRGRTAKAVWNLGEQPTFEIDLRNRGSKEWEIRAVSLTTIVEIDGVWHRLGGIANVPSQIEQLKPGEQKNAWFVVAPNKSWIRNLTPETSAPLEWKPGKHKVRLGYTIKDKVQPITAAIEIEIVDPKEVGWGKPDGDFQVRLHSVKKSYSGGELPALVLDLRNQSKNDVVVEQFAFEIEADGVWYYVPMPDILLPTRKIKAGEQIDNWADFLVDGKAWRRSAQDGIGPGPLVLSPGKHKIRAAYLVANKIRPISEVVEIEIVDPKELGWGELSGDLQARLRPVKSPNQAETHIPLFEMDLRNRGNKDVVTALHFTFLEIEVGGIWYSRPRTPNLRIPPQVIKAGEQIDKWGIIQVDEGVWQRTTTNANPPEKLKLTTGKHIIRAAYPIATNVRPITPKVEFVVDDAKE